MSDSQVSTQVRPPAPIEVLRKQLIALTPEIRSALPAHIKPEKFTRVVNTVVGMTPDLLVADRKSLLASCMKCAADGLVPDGREAALVIFNTKAKSAGGRDEWIKKVQYMPMLAGIQKRVRNSGEVASVEAHVIYEHDRFVWRQGMDGNIEHEPKFPGDRGKPIGAYAIAKFKDGSLPLFEVMDRDEIERVRAVSKSKDSGPWVSWWGEMAAAFPNGCQAGQTLPTCSGAPRKMQSKG
jgi:recombination protein RecT